jgi:hypothetical protein
LLHASSSANILKVLGDSGDKVNTAGFSDSTIDKTVDSITYDIYTHSDANTQKNLFLSNFFCFVSLFFTFLYSLNAITP